IPPSSRSHHSHPAPHGAGSLLIDTNLDTATFHVSAVRQNGIFLPPISPSPTSDPETSTKTTIDIYTLEVWGLVPDSSDDGSGGEPGQSAIDQQRARWEFEARDAERRRNVNFKAGGDSSVESARWLL